MSGPTTQEKLQYEIAQLKSINAELLAAVKRLMDVTEIEPVSQVTEATAGKAATWIYNVRCVRCDPDFVAAIEKAKQSRFTMHRPSASTANRGPSPSLGVMSQLLILLVNSQRPTTGGYKVSEMKTIYDVQLELENLASQIMHPKDNSIRRMEKVVTATIKDIERLDVMLTVPAAEYVPAIADAFLILDKIRGSCGGKRTNAQPQGE